MSVEIAMTRRCASTSTECGRPRRSPSARTRSPSSVINPVSGDAYQSQCRNQETLILTKTTEKIELEFVFSQNSGGHYKVGSETSVFTLDIDAIGPGVRAYRHQVERLPSAARRVDCSKADERGPTICTVSAWHRRQRGTRIPGYGARRIRTPGQTSIQRLDRRYRIRSRAHREVWACDPCGGRACTSH